MPYPIHGITHSPLTTTETHGDAKKENPAWKTEWKTWFNNRLMFISWVSMELMSAFPLPFKILIWAPYMFVVFKGEN